MAGLGYANAIVQEGQNSWGGTTWPSNEGWAVFRVLINLATGLEDPERVTVAFLVGGAALQRGDAVHRLQPGLDALLATLRFFGWGLATGD